MLDYLQKFNNLPEDVREKISSAQVMARMSELEAKYGINLAAIVMRVMVDDIKMVDLAKFFVFEHGLDGRVASELVEEMKAKVFFDVADFLGIITVEDRMNEADIDERIKQEKFGVRSSTFFFSPEDEEEVQTLAKNVNEVENAIPNVDEKVEFTMLESNVSFGSEELNNRFRQIIKTYIKGIRNRIDAKQALMKPVADGGLGMNMNLVERAIFVAEQCKREMAGAPVAPIPRMKLPEDIIRMTGAVPSITEIVKTPPIAGARDAAYDFSALAAKKSDAEAAVARKKHTFRVGIEQLAASSKKSYEEKADYKSMPGGDAGAASAIGGQVIAEQPDPWVEREKARMAEEKIANIAELELPKPLDLKGATETIEDKVAVAADPMKPLVVDLKEAAVASVAEAAVIAPLADSEKKAEVPAEPEVVIPARDIKAGEEQASIKAESLPLKRESVPSVPKSITEEKPQAVIQPQPIRIISPIMEGKTKMDDIKYVPKLVGPIDELREMSLVNFRRLGENPAEVVAKFKKRLDLFEEEEGYGKKLEAAKAWRQSPVNSLYLQMGQEAIMQKNGVDGAMKVRQGNNQDYLTVEEFNAIMDFNKSIRF